MKMTIDGAPMEASAGDTVLVALARAGTLPAGCLCLGGDCPSCLATIDGRSHMRMCQTPAREGMVVVSWPVRIRSEEVVVATGGAELQPIAPGSHLAGILTPGAATICRGPGYLTRGRSTDTWR